MQLLEMSVASGVFPLGEASALIVRKNWTKILDPLLQFSFERKKRRYQWSGVVLYKE